MLGQGTDKDDGEWHRRNIKRRAERKYGGTTTPWRLSQQVKIVSQKYGVGGHVTLVPLPGKGVRIELGSGIERQLRFNDSYSSFLHELLHEIQDCGYDAAFGDSFLEVHRV